LFQRFIDSPSFTPEVLVAFLNSCHDHAEYLMTKYTTRSNWGLMEAEGMAFIAMTFPEFDDAEKWREEAFRRLNNEINIQVYPDGHQRELAMGYHLGCIGWFFRTYELAKMNGIENAFPDSYLERIEKMCEVPMKLCLPNGTNVQFGDAWEGTPGQHNERFREWAEFFGREDFLYLASDGKEGKKPDSTAYALPVSGLYSMRSDWNEDAVCLVLKCGPDGGGHSQPDNGTFDLYAGGRNLMPDAGSYIYSGNPEGRAWFRQTKVHQTLTLDGKNSKYAPDLILWQPGDSLDILVVENKSYENLTHRRAVFFVDKRYFVIVDEAFGFATGDVAIHFQLAPGGGDAVFNRDCYSVRSGFQEGWNVFVQTQNQPGLQLEEEEGWVSFKYTKKEPRPAFRYRLKKETENSNVRFVTLVIPFEKEVPEMQITRVTDESGKLEIEVLENGERKMIGYSMN
jgi:heparan-sulfate lyase